MVLTKEVIARELADILGYPYQCKGGPQYKLVTTVISVIVSALQRGETVHISGFGTFKPRVRRAYRTSYPVRHKDINEVVGKGRPPTYRGKRMSVLVPEKVIVHFQPAPHLIRFINDH